MSRFFEVLWILVYVMVDFECFLVFGCWVVCINFLCIWKGIFLFVEIILCLVILICFSVFILGYFFLLVVEMIFVVIFFVVYMCDLYIKILFINWFWSDFFWIFIVVIFYLIIFIVVFVERGNYFKIVVGVLGLIVMCFFGYDVYVIFFFW